MAPINRSLAKGLAIAALGGMIAISTAPAAHAAPAPGYTVNLVYAIQQIVAGGGGTVDNIAVTDTNGTLTGSGYDTLAYCPGVVNGTVDHTTGQAKLNLTFTGGQCAGVVVVFAGLLSPGLGAGKWWNTNGFANQPWTAAGPGASLTHYTPINVR